MWVVGIRQTNNCWTMDVLILATKSVLLVEFRIQFKIVLKHEAPCNNNNIQHLYVVFAELLKL